MMETVPPYEDLMWPTLRALNRMGGSGTISEIVEEIIEIMNLPPSITDLPHGDSARSEVEYRAAWARTYLKFINTVTNSARGVWTITESGRRISSDDELRALSRMERASRSRRRQSTAEPTSPEIENVENDLPIATTPDWSDRLLEILRGIDPTAFERLCQRVLRESGFIEVEVLGRSGDGGIDGAGILRINLLSFHVRFQCKRYSDAVGASAIRDFRGAMVGRADKGLFLTTGRFTQEAKREAVRDGAPAIDLIDGEALCVLLQRLELGVTTRMVPKVEIDFDFFEKI